MAEIIQKTLKGIESGLQDAVVSGCNIPNFSGTVEFECEEDRARATVKFKVPFLFQREKPVIDLSSLPDLLKIPISDCGFTTRIVNALSTRNVETIGELIQLSELDLLGIRNMGHESILRINYFLEQYNLHLKER
jgi:DNA-directed RNA polymerase alpha subunit